MPPVDIDTGARGSGFLQTGGGGVHLILRSTSKKRGSRRGPNFGPNVKKPTTWPKKGSGRLPPPPPPPSRIRPCRYLTELDLSPMGQRIPCIYMNTIFWDAILYYTNKIQCTSNTCIGPIHNDTVNSWKLNMKYIYSNIVF